MLRTAGSIPVGTANAKQKNRPKRAVFLLFFANFCTGQIKAEQKPLLRIHWIAEFYPCFSQRIHVLVV